MQGKPYGILTAVIHRRAFEEEYCRKVISDQSYIEKRKKLQSGDDIDDET